MFLLGKTRYIDFRLSASGQTISNFNVIFNRNNSVCLDTITLHDLGTGLYSVSYNPTSEGHDYIDLFHVSTSTRITNSEDIILANNLNITNIINLTKDYGSSNNLKIIQDNPQNYTLYLFKSIDWISGRNSINFSLYQTNINNDGTWKISTIPIIPDTYHLILISSSTTIIFKSFLVIS